MSFFNPTDGRSVARRPIDRRPIDRRTVLRGALAGASLPLLGAGPGQAAGPAAAPPKEIVLGYQKTGIPLIARQLGVYEKIFQPQGIQVKWAEFLSGLNLLQAMDAGSVVFGNAGDVGTLFLQAGGGRVTYIAAQPTAPKSEGILVKRDSPIQSLKDLKGRRVGFAKGSSSHNLLLAALETVGLTPDDIQQNFLNAADAPSAFENGHIDAWVIWDPYFSIAQRREPTRILAHTGDVLTENASFLLANSAFVETHPDIVANLVKGATEVGEWAGSHREEVAKLTSEATGIALDVTRLVTANASFRVTPVTDSVVAGHQKTAERLYRAKVLPKPVTVRDAVWKPQA